MDKLRHSRFGETLQRFDDLLEEAQRLRERIVASFRREVEPFYPERRYHFEPREPERRKHGEDPSFMNEAD